MLTSQLIAMSDVFFLLYSWFIKGSMAAAENNGDESSETEPNQELRNASTHYKTNNYHLQSQVIIMYGFTDMRNPIHIFILFIIDKNYCLKQLTFF